MFPAHADLARLAPEIVLTAFGILAMLLAPFADPPRKDGRRSGSWVVGISVFGAVLAILSTLYPARDPGDAFSGLLRVDDFSLFVHWIVLGVALLVLLGSANYLRREDLPPGEFCALVLFAAVGMCVMASAEELITVFIGLEISSISSYILVSYRRDSPLADEAAMKYFLLGSFATAFFLYGVALVYGATGTTHLDLVTSDAVNAASRFLPIGLGLILVGLAFKVAAAPFQIWAPDVYQGAPTPVTAFLSTGPKAATFAVMLRIVGTIEPASGVWVWALWGMAVLSMFGGNLAALVQSNAKRMLAYSSIAHAGYILVAVAAAAAAATRESAALCIAAAIFYLAAYALMKLGAFLMIAQLSGPDERRQDLDDFAGLGSRQPVAAAGLSIFLLSLLGLPLTAGFLAKFYVFRAGLSSGLFWLVVLLAINSVIAAYYYLRVIVVMYMREPKQEWPLVRISAAASFALFVAAAGTVYLGLFPSRVVDFAMRAAASLR
jgi:NADH-quinone oxidoreductase subunit N